MIFIDNDTMDIIGNTCKKYRKYLDLALKDVASGARVSVSTASEFERGISFNGQVLLFYMLNGLTFEEMTGGYVDGKKHISMATD